MNARQGRWIIAALLMLAGCRTSAMQREAARKPSISASSNLARSAGQATLAAPEERVGKVDVIQTSAMTMTAARTIVPTTESAAVADSTVQEQRIGGLTLSLHEAVATGLVQNPDLIAMRGMEGVSVAALGVAETYPWNPFVQTQLLPAGRPLDRGTGPGTGSGKANYYVWVMQRFELAHQRHHREQSATASLNQVRWNIQQAELMNIALTTRLYFVALYQHDLHDLAQESSDLNEKLLGVVQRRFEANLATAAEVTTAKVAARQSRQQAHLAEATYQAALLALRQQLNVPLTAPLEMTDHMHDFAWQPVRSVESPESPMNLKLEALAADLVEGRPDVMAACAGVMVARANEQLAQAAQIPDVQAGPIYEVVDTGTSFLGARLQMDLPVWNNGAPLAHQRHMEWHQQSLTYAQLKTRAALEAQMAIDRYERARRLAEKSHVELSSFAEQMPPDLREIMSQFEAGQADVLAVFVTQNNLIQERRTYLDLLNELAQSAAAVIQTTALPPDHLITPRAPH